MKKIVLLSTMCAYILADDISKFVPDISLIFDGSYVNRNISDEKATHLEVPSIAHGILAEHSHGGETHSTYNAKNGFNLNYGELKISSNVDPVFTLDGVFHFSEHSSEIEELYFTSNILGDGLRLKGGKFMSNFGYLNEQHHHVWDFMDMPLAYEAFLGVHGINEKGVQLQYTMPLTFYMMIGAELLQGENENSFGYESLNVGGVKYATSKKAPAMSVAYIKSSYDIGDTTLFGGLSYAKGSSRLNHSDDDESPHLFSGDTKLYGVDFVLLHQLNSYSSIKWQSEYLLRKLDGTAYLFNDDETLKSSPSTLKKQSALYSQIVYRHNANWKMGFRYDTIIKNSVYKNSDKIAMPNNLDRYSAMLEYDVSEFAKLRVQYNYDKSLFDEDKRVKINSFMIGANIAIGAHGAHSF